MDTWLMQLLSASNGRHFRDDEIQRIMMYAESLPTRLTAVKEIADQRDALAKHLSKNVEVFAGNPSFAADVVETLFTVSQAMLLDDLNVVETKLADRLYAVGVLMELGSDQMQSIFSIVETNLYSRVSPETKELMEPYFTWARDRLTAMVEETDYATV